PPPLPPFSSAPPPPPPPPPTFPSRVRTQVCTVLLFLFVAAWPFAPILVHWKPWAPQPTVAFLALLLTLAWVLVARSHSIFAALLSSWLTLALTGLTAWEYTTEQVRLHQ
ncbi:unnamed protein product, partial [Sphacelaria rigidula]